MLKKLTINTLGGLILFITCQLSHGTATVDNAAKPIYERFLNIATECGVNVNRAELRIEMSYSIPNKHYYAITYTQINLIVINNYAFRYLSENEKEQTIMHELGHALLKLHHDDRGLNLMNAIGFITEKDYRENYDYFIRRLFIDCKKPLMEKFVYE